MKVQFSQFSVTLQLLATICWSASIFLACSRGDEDYGPDQTEKPEPDPISNSRPLPAPSSLLCEKGTYLSFNNFGDSFLGNYCTSCHHTALTDDLRNGAPPEANFETPYLAQVWRASILMKAGGEASTMPPSQDVPSQERKDFTEWLNCGAPE